MQKTVLITGASSGFGKEAALLFKQKGWNVVATMRTPSKASSWATDLLVLSVDVTDRASMQSAVDATVAKFGRIDVLVNNAGFGVSGPLEGVPPEEIRRQFNTNVVGLIEMTQLVIPVMRKQGDGVIVNISSVGGFISGPLLSLYIASKWAVEGFSESVQYELGTQNIRVKVIEPGGSNTNFEGSSQVVVSHPAYEPLVSNLSKTRAKLVAKVPGPEKVAARIYQAATDGSKRLRYPVITGGYLVMRRVLGARGWQWLIRQVTRNAAKG
jgi:NAD(P)-dependent dehydrogenase (short-subunit alcohol dehydrogenase family)